MTFAARSQTTLATTAAVSGRGYWSGAKTRVEFRPAPADTGVVFVRDDLGPDARIPLSVTAQRPTPRRTVLSADQGTSQDSVEPITGEPIIVEMVEHVAAALAGLGVDNCEVGVTAAEMPGMDGSSLAFVQAIDNAGLVHQEAAIKPLIVTKPVRCERGETWIEARPPTADLLSIEFNLDFGPDSPIASQWMVLDLDPMAFRTELAPARTFVLQSEADAILAAGLASHVTPSDLLIFPDEARADGAPAGATQPIDNTLRYPDECVRHKMLDVVGDLALAGRPVVGRITACRSGHMLNAELVRELLAIEAESDSHKRCA